MFGKCFFPLNFLLKKKSLANWKFTIINNRAQACFHLKNLVWYGRMGQTVYFPIKKQAKITAQSAVTIACKH